MHVYQHLVSKIYKNITKICEKMRKTRRSFLSIYLFDQSFCYWKVFKIFFYILLCENMSLFCCCLSVYDESIWLIMFNLITCVCINFSFIFLYVTPTYIGGYTRRLIDNYMINFLCLILGAIILASPLSGQNAKHLLGAKECTWGPTHWCANFQ